MDLWDLTRLLLRRWYVAVPMLLVSVAVVLVAGQSVKPDYSASGHMVLIPPRGPGQTAPGVEPAKIRNPWNELGFEALGQAAIIKVHDKKVLDGLEAAGFTPNITVTIDYRTPVFAIEAVGASPTQATGTVRQVMKLLDEAVAAAQKQYAVTEQDLITTLALDSGDQVTTVTSKVKRVLVVALGISLLVTAAATIVVDALLRRRGRRLEGAVGPDATDRSSDQRARAPVRQQPAKAVDEETARIMGIDDLFPAASAVLQPASATSEGHPEGGVAGAAPAGADGGRNRDNAVGEPAAVEAEETVRALSGLWRKPRPASTDREARLDPFEATVVLPVPYVHRTREDDRGKRR